MAESGITSLVSPPSVPDRSSGWVWWAVVFALRPVRLAYHRPLRALLVCGAILVATAALLVGGLLAYFEYHLRVARREVDLGHNAVATRHLWSCRWVRPEQREVLLLASRVARRSGSWSESELLLDRYWERYGDDEALVLERLLDRATRGDVDSAAPHLLSRIEQGGPEANLAREALITGLVYRFRWAEAVGLLDSWLSQAPDTTTALLLRGKLQEQRRQTSEALLTYRRMLELDPAHDEARLRLATLLLILRQGGEAATHLGYLRQTLPDNPIIHTQWAQALALQGRTAEARAALDDCLRAHPDQPAALTEGGRFALTDGDDRAAEEYFSHALRLDPGNLATRNLHLMVLVRSGKTAEADKERVRIATLEADGERIDKLISGPLQNTPNDPAVHHEIGMIALRAGQPIEALRWFQSSLQVGPNYLPTHQILATYYHETGNPVLAAKHRAISQRLSAPKGP
jgi:tetratricopeptide (TPR) repeat protein